MHYLRGVAISKGLSNYLFIPVIDLLTALAYDHHLQGEREKAEWERIRMLCYYAGLGNFKKGTKPKSLFTFPWEKGSLTKERIKEVNDIMKNDKRFPDRL